VDTNGRKVGRKKEERKKVKEGVEMFPKYSSYLTLTLHCYGWSLSR
jgi:hypothetical protein